MSTRERERESVCVCVSVRVCLHVLWRKCEYVNMHDQGGREREEGGYKKGDKAEAMDLHGRGEGSTNLSARSVSISLWISLSLPVSFYCSGSRCMSFSLFSLSLSS